MPHSFPTRRVSDLLVVLPGHGHRLAQQQAGVDRYAGDHEGRRTTCLDLAHHVEEDDPAVPYAVPVVVEGEDEVAILDLHLSLLGREVQDVGLPGGGLDFDRLARCRPTAPATL